VVLCCLVVSLIALQGCGRGGTWFPKADRPVRKKAYWDTTNNDRHRPEEPGERNMGFQEPYNDPERLLDTGSVRKSKR
ncbi:MAG: hypothetical protein HQ515_18285, partial [Phycisphaeraceae bacterium]|nr:hypothetical protein [Phycisphaeraceae bacterium]